MLHNWSDSNLIFVNKRNLDFYLPGISESIKDIEVDVSGRLDLIKRKFKPSTKSLAVRCDVIRANLLNEYGGIYIDISSIALRSIDKYFQIINDINGKNFICSQRQSHGKTHYPVSFYGCNTKSKIIKLYSKKINELIRSKNTFHYNELGAESFTPIVDEYIDEAVIIDQAELMPIPFEDADRLCPSKNIELDDIFTGDPIAFKLFSGVFKNSLADLNIMELYHGDNVVGKVFRKALPIVVFEKYHSM